MYYRGENRRWKRDSSTAKWHFDNISCLNEEKENTGIRCSEPREQILPLRTRWRTAAASSSSCSNRSIATHYTAAGRYIRIHTRTSCSSVQYNNYNRSGPGTLSWTRTRCLYVTKREKKVIATQRAAAAAPATLLNYRLLRRHFTHHRWSYIFYSLLEQKKVTQK